MTSSDHKPILVYLDSIQRNRVDCTCGAKDLAWVKPTAGMAPVISVMRAHREAQP